MIQEDKVTKEVLASGSGCNDVEFWYLKVEDVVRGLMSDTRFDGHFHYKFEMDQNADGERVFCEGYSCKEFRLNTLRIGEGIVPVSLVLYVDGTSTFTRTSAFDLFTMQHPGSDPAWNPIQCSHYVNIIIT